MEAEEASAATGLEVEQLRARLSSVLNDLETRKAGDRTTTSSNNTDNAHDNNDNKSQGDGDDDATTTTNTNQEKSADTPSAAAAADAVNTDMDDNGLSQQEQQQQEPEERSLKPEGQEQEHLLAAEQSRSFRELQADLNIALARVEELERSGSEAMEAAGTEAARAAAAREGLEGAEAELVELRGRLGEWEEEMTRAAELKGTLEMTRDAMDELRSVGPIGAIPCCPHVYPRIGGVRELIEVIPHYSGYVPAYSRGCWPD